jgi:hypothetical protein
MKKLFFIAVTLFAVTTTQAQTSNNVDVVDTLTTNSKLAQNKLTLPNNISEEMVISRNATNGTLVATFTKHLTESDIELVKNYINYYYERWQPKGSKYNSSAPDIDNKKRSCVIIFYKL